MKRSLIVLVALVMTVMCLFAGCSGKSKEPKATPKTALVPAEPAAPSGKVDVPVTEGKEYKEAVFGRYPSSEVKDEQIVKALDAMAVDARDAATGFYTYEEKQYQKEIVITKDPETQTDVTSVYWYEVEPITWYVLDESDGGMLLIASRNVNARKFNEKLEDTNWGVSTLRDWLNGMGDYQKETSFYNSAFSADEQSVILTQDITTEANPKYGTAGGDATKDRVTILSIEDLEKASSWSEKSFAPAAKGDVSLRACGNTDYAIFKGAAKEVSYVLRSSSWQWLRNTGSYAQNAAFISESGVTMAAGYVVTFDQIGVRPVIRLNTEYVNVVED